MQEAETCTTQSSVAAHVASCSVLQTVNPWASLSGQTLKQPPSLPSLVLPSLVLILNESPPLSLVPSVKEPVPELPLVPSVKEPEPELPLSLVPSLNELVPVLLLSPPKSSLQEVVVPHLQSPVHCDSSKFDEHSKSMGSVVCTHEPCTCVTQPARASHTESCGVVQPAVKSGQTL